MLYSERGAIRSLSSLGTCTMHGGPAAGTEWVVCGHCHSGFSGFSGFCRNISRSYRALYGAIVQPSLDARSACGLMLLMRPHVHRITGDSCCKCNIMVRCVCAHGASQRMISQICKPTPLHATCWTHETAHGCIPNLRQCQVTTCWWAPPWKEADVRNETGLFVRHESTTRAFKHISVALCHCHNLMIVACYILRFIFENPNSTHGTARPQEIAMSVVSVFHIGRLRTLLCAVSQRSLSVRMHSQFTRSRR